MYSTKSATNLDDIENDNIIISTNNNKLYINCLQGETIKSIRVLDTQGRPIITESHINSTSYNREITGSGVYIINISAEKSNSTKKIVIH